MTISALNVQLII